MIINVLAVPEGYSETVFVISNADKPPEWPAVSLPVTAECRISRHGREISIEIEFSGGLLLECSRCLKRFSYPVEGAAIVVLEPHDPGRPEAVDEDHSIFYYSEQQPEVDLGPAIFDELMTSLPIMPLCSESCEGIPVTGSGTAENPPGKPAADEVDPRWEALKKLRKGSN